MPLRSNIENQHTTLPFGLWILKSQKLKLGLEKKLVTN